MSVRKKVTCPHCGKPMSLGAKGCRSCFRGGRLSGTDHDYAAELGLSVRRLRRLGGEAHLRSLTPAMRALMTKPFATGNSRTVHKGGLRARGMIPRVPGRLTQPQEA